jgi:class 3 adenylate cyclase
MSCGCGLPVDAHVDPREERKVVSVLSCDLAGFTTRSERLDVEDVAGFLEPYQDAVREAVARHGGALGEFAGDGVIAVFGAPVTHEDDAERAVLAGLAIQEAVARLRSAAPELDLHARVGVNTGEALVRVSPTGRTDVVGDTVNTAARLEAAAPVDHVLVGEATRLMTERAIRYAAVAPVVAKGKAAPVAAWVASTRRPQPPQQTRDDDVQLIGRDAELGLLEATLCRVIAQSAVQLITVIGVPGIGKSRLVRELGERVKAMPERVRWRRGRSLAYGEGVAFWALGEILKSEAGVLETDTAVVAQERLVDVVSELPIDGSDRPWVAHQLSPLVGVDVTTTDDAGGTQAFAAWRRFLEALARDRPTVLVFEDIHWADDALFEFIEGLVDRAGPVPLLIVCTARPELLERRPGWRDTSPTATTINLAPLSPDRTSVLVGELVTRSALSSETRSRIVAQADGNPLYAQEFVRMLRDRQFPAPVSDVADADMPASIQAVIAARLDTLSAQDKAFLQTAAVVGRTAWLGAACAISGLPPAEAQEHLREAERRQLVRREPRSSVADDVEFSFTHALVRDVAYRQLRRDKRAEKHEQAGAWIEQLSGGRDDKAEMLAYHYTTALHLYHETGRDADPLVPKARRASAAAGRQAAAVSAHAAARRHLETAIDLTDAADPARPQLLFDHATAAYRCGDADENTLKAAADALAAAGDWWAAADANMMLSEWFDNYAGWSGSSQWHEAMDRAGDYATRSGNSWIASWVTVVRAKHLLLAGRTSEGLPLLEDAQRSAEDARDEVGRALALSWHGALRLDLGDPGGLEEMEEAASIFAQHGHFKTFTNYSNLASCLVAFGDLRRAADARAKAAPWAERFGDIFQLESASWDKADSAYHAGDWNTALDLLSPIADGATTDTYGTVCACSLRGRIRLAQGVVDVARSDAARTVAYGARNRNPQTLLEGLALTAETHHASGDIPAAGAACMRFFQCWHETGGDAESVLLLPALAGIPHQSEAIGSALACVGDAYKWKPAVVAIIEQRPAEAAEIFHEIGSAPLEATAHVLATRAAIAERRFADATHHAGQALAFCDQVGAVLYAEQVRNLLADSSEIASMSPSTGRSS